MMTEHSAEDALDPRDVIDAFADREAVDADTLVRALESADGRRYFVDLLTLRRLVRGPHPVPKHAANTGARTRSAPARWWAIAATIAVITGTGGYLGGFRMAGRPAEVVTSPVAPTPPAALTATTPPSPTEVIRLERGVDWVERFGG